MLRCLGGQPSSVLMPPLIASSPMLAMRLQSKQRLHIKAAAVYVYEVYQTHELVMIVTKTANQKRQHNRIAT